MTKTLVNAIDDLHPLARDALTNCASVGYFRSDRMCRAIAEKDPRECMKWAVALVSHRAENNVRLPAVVANTFCLIQTLTDAPDAEKLPVIGELAEQSWFSASFDDESLVLQRAIARLGWAAIACVCLVTSTSFACERVAVTAGDNEKTGLATLVQQCAAAIDMTYTGTHDGRLMIAADFTRQMSKLS